MSFRSPTAEMTAYSGTDQKDIPMIRAFTGTTSHVLYRPQLCIDFFKRYAAAHLKLKRTPF